jgi:hypothetical protein
MGFGARLFLAYGRPTDRRVIPALADLQRRHVDPGMSRRGTVALPAVGMIGARSVNPVHVADARGPVTVDPAPTRRRLLRFLQHAGPFDDRAGPMIARPARGAATRGPGLDRTNCNVGQAHVNLPGPAARTSRTPA